MCPISSEGSSKEMPLSTIAWGKNVIRIPFRNGLLDEKYLGFHSESFLQFFFPELCFGIRLYCFFYTCREWGAGKSRVKKDHPTLCKIAARCCRKKVLVEFWNKCHAMHFCSLNGSRVHVPYENKFFETTRYEKKYLINTKYYLKRIKHSIILIWKSSGMWLPTKRTVRLILLFRLTLSDDTNHYCSLRILIGDINAVYLGIIDVSSK